MTPTTSGPLTAICSDCGSVFWADQGHSCSGRPCSSCAAVAAELAQLREDVAAMDRGLARTGEIAAKSLKLATEVREGINDWHEDAVASRLARQTPEQRRAQFELIRGDAA